jgi:hypothetical protein
MRLDFSHSTPEMIGEAVARLARAARTTGARQRGGRRPNHAVPSSRLTP